jgi:hypothetical protein
MEEKIIERHKLAIYENKITYPLIIDPESHIVGAIGAVTAWAISGDPVAILPGLAGGELLDISKKIVSAKVQEYGRKLFNPYHKYIGFNPQDFILFTGFKKDKNRNLVTVDFKKTARPQDEPNDKYYGETLAYHISELKTQLPPYSRDDLFSREDEFMGKLFKKDVLAVGGPINIDPLFELMKGKDLPCSYEIVNPLTYPLKKTAGNIRYRYQIVRKGRTEPLIPEWNKLNWGIITCMEKSVIFPKEAKGGLFFSISGCNYIGMGGAVIFLRQKDNLQRLQEVVERRLGKTKNFQAVVKVPWDAQHSHPVYEQIELLDDEVYKIS